MTATTAPSTGEAAAPVVPAGTARAIEVRHLTKRFGAVKAVDDLTFTVEPGLVCGFLGPNGAGKTTTLRTLLGLVAPTSGDVTIGGERYADLRRPMETVGALLDASSFHPGRTARNHLRVLCAASGIDERRIDEVLLLAGLHDAADRRVGGFSTGMRQRLGLAAALLGDPGVLVLDEPATGLDPAGINWLRELLRHFAHELHRTVLLSSHLLAEMEHIADEIVIIADGRLVRQGPLQEMVRGVTSTVRVRAPRLDDLAVALAAAGMRVQRDGDALTVLGASTVTVGHHAFANGIELSELTEVRGDLEDVFLQLTNGTPTMPPLPPGAQEVAA